MAFTALRPTMLTPDSAQSDTAATASRGRGTNHGGCDPHQLARRPESCSCALQVVQAPADPGRAKEAA